MARETLKNIAATVLGIIVMLMPLALWVAWTGTMFVAVLAIGAAAGGLYCVLAGDRPPTLEGRHGPRVLSDEFLSELTKLGPWIHHNRRPGDPEFRRKVDRALKLLE